MTVLGFKLVVVVVKVLVVALRAVFVIASHSDNGLPGVSGGGLINIVLSAQVNARVSTVPEVVLMPTVLDCAEA